LGHLRFMRGYLSSAAPSFSNQEPRAHKLWPEFLATIQGGMKREGWGLFKSVSFSLPWNQDCLTGLDNSRHSCWTHAVPLYLRGDFPINSKRMKHVLNYDTLLSLVLIRLFVCLSVGGIPQPWRKDFHEIWWGRAGFGPGTVDSFSLVIERRDFQHYMWHKQRKI